MFYSHTLQKPVHPYHPPSLTKSVRVNLIVKKLFSKQQLTTPFMIAESNLGGNTPCGKNQFC
jgi:hypothetical protein